MTTRDLPLAGRTVLLTRPALRGEILARMLRDLGASVDCRPTIALVPPADPSRVERAMSDLDRFDWLAFSSPTGARFFIEACQKAQRFPGEKTRIVAIGPATARELASAGLSVAVQAETSTTEGLLDALDGRLPPGSRALVVQPAAARERLARGLEQLGAEVQPVEFYRNEPAPGVAEVATRLCSGSYDLVVFTSPSTLHRLLESEPDTPGLRDALLQVRRVAIGSVTAHALFEAGLPAHATAARPTDAALRDAILETLRS